LIIRQSNGNDIDIPSTVGEEISDIADRLNWKGKRKDINTMDKDQLVSYQKELSEISLDDYLDASRSRIIVEREKVAQKIQDNDTNLNASRSDHDYDDESGEKSGDENEESGEKSGDGSGDHSQNDSNDKNGDQTGDQSSDQGDERHKNADQDTVSKARRSKLGKGDYQTIAETTTVTTVRRGKRPVVQREHTSTTTPGDDDDDDAVVVDGVLSRKRKSRIPKTKARRKKLSQKGGKYSIIEDYIHFLQRAKRKKLE
jgi:hypothetical protein